MTNKIKAIINAAYTTAIYIAIIIVANITVKLIAYFIGDWLNLIICAVLIIALAFWLYRFNLKEIQEEKDDEETTR